jgi:eukaryotic-like serine/threonine-protein kinase
VSDGTNASGADDAAKERFRLVDALFDEALDLSPEARAAFLAQVTSDPLVRDEVFALLDAHDRSTAFLAGGPSVVGAEHDATSSDDAQLARVQRAVGDQYLVRQKVAVGGMATVYVAHDRRHHRAVAIKVFVEESGSMLGERDGGRFLAEIRTVARLQHAHIVPLFDSGAADGLLYYVMPFVNGETLRQRLQRESPLPVAEAVRLTVAMASALTHAHREAIVHRDLKPENILLRDGEPLIADFGIALGLAGGDERLTRTGMLIGTPRYMSPEQAFGDGDIDARTDVYSLGVMLYEMLTGETPHVASGAQAMLAKVRVERATPVHLLRDTVPVNVSAVLDRALTKQPADRWESAQAFSDALQAAGRAPAGSADLPQAASTSLPGEPPSAARAAPGASRRGWLGAAAAVVTVIAVGSIFSRRGTGPAVEPVPANGAALAAVRMVVAPLPDAAVGRAPTMTSDGAQLVYAGSVATGRRIFVRPLTALRARSLAGTEGALRTFVSPDGQWIAFITSEDKLMKVSVDGGAPIVLGSMFRYGSGAWAGNDRLVLDGIGQQGLSWMSAAGGARNLLTRVDSTERDSGHNAPFVFPDGKTVAFTIRRDMSGPGLLVGELALVTLDPSRTDPAPPSRLGVVGGVAVGFVDGWLLYTSADRTAIMAMRIDTATLRPQGAAVRVLEQEDGALAPVPVLSAPGLFAVSASPDGARLLFQRSINGVWSVWQAAASSGYTPEPVVQETYDAFMPSLSPDGRWLAYAANGTGRHEIYVRPFPGPGAPVQVSQDGGTEPAWSADGRRLYFRSQRRMYVASVAPSAEFTVTARRVLFSDAFDGDMPMPHRNYDVMRDGHHFVMIAAAADAVLQTVVVLDWLPELRAILDRRGSR